MSIHLTKNQALILSIFFANPQKSFYFRELARMLNKAPGVFQKDINDLEVEGFINSNFIGRSRFFRLNKKYPFYNEIKNIINKTVGIEKIIAGELYNINGIKNAFIYGSYAQGTNDTFSDIDMIIIGNINEKLLEKTLLSIEKRYKREINYTIYSSTEFDKKKKSDPFVRMILAKKIIKLY
jgi:predicted nucleotidyltransferase